MTRSPVVNAVCFLALAVGCRTAAGQYVSSDTYTRYELLAPGTNQFKIYYEVTETKPGAKFHFNVIREGSEASDESVVDAATGKPLKFEVVSGAAAKTEAPEENFSPTASYIKVFLTHPVPTRGEYRIVIVKTYKDAKSYYAEGDRIVFKRSLSIPRDSVVLPRGYETLSCSVAAQVLPEPDGRLRLAFINPGSGGPLEVTIAARPLPPGSPLPRPAAASESVLSERAWQDREIQYELQSPESHAFRITHDYTARTPGESCYFNVVRPGARVTSPDSIDLDSGESLKWEVLSGKQVREQKLPLAETASDDSEIVVTRLARPVAEGATNRIRLRETYVDAKSYYMDGDELVWDRSFGRPRNMVVLPPGWSLTALGSPATVQQLPDGRVAVSVVNPRNDNIRVYLRAHRRPPEELTKEKILATNAQWQEKYDRFDPSAEMLAAVKAKATGLKVVVYLGQWCPDSRNNVPPFLKVLDRLGTEVPVRYWGVPRKASRDMKYYVENMQVEKVPSFIFYRDGKEIGRIIENPKTGMMEDLMDIICK